MGLGRRDSESDVGRLAANSMSWLTSTTILTFRKWQDDTSYQACSWAGGECDASDADELLL